MSLPIACGAGAASPRPGRTGCMDDASTCVRNARTPRELEQHDFITYAGGESFVLETPGHVQDFAPRRKVESDAEALGGVHR